MSVEMLQEITVTSTRPVGARQPRGIVRVGPFGQETVLPGWIEFSVSNNSVFEADTWQVIFATSLLPAARDVNWFSEQKETFVEIFAGVPTNPASPTASDPNMMSLIYGRIDDLQLDPVARTLTLKGRDLTGVFIDAKLSADYSNQTASDIAETLANNHGLDYTTYGTVGAVGSYYNLDKMQLQAGRSEWDLLTYLARQNGFVTYMLGRTLYFGPDTTDDNDPYLIKWVPPSADSASPSANVMDIVLTHNQTVAKGITVTVRAAGLLNKTVTASYPTAPKAIGAGKASPYGASTNYYFNMLMGSTPMQVQQRAQAIYNDIIQHEMKLSAHLPGDNRLSTQATISLVGTGTAFDQIYYPTVVTRTMSVDEGYSMTVEAQSSSPNLTPAPEPPNTGPQTQDTADSAETADAGPDESP